MKIVDIFQKITRKNLDIFLKKHSTNERVLDVGSGGSSYSRYFPNRLTVDVDPGRKPEIIADAHKLPFKDSEFKFVLCTEVLEHVNDPKVVLGELNRVLEIGGKLILTTRFVYPIHDMPHDYWRFTYYGMKELFTNWKIIELVPETKTFSTIGALLQRISFQTNLKGGRVTKFFIMLLAKLFDNLNFLIIDEFGEINKKNNTKNIMSTGYYIVAIKK